MPHRRKNYREETRSTYELILAIAVKEVEVHGVEGLRLKEIADQVGIKLPSLYAHFAGRKELLEAMANRLMDELTQMQMELAGLPPREELMAGADRSIDFYIANKGYARLLLSEFPVPFEYSVFNNTGCKIGEFIEGIEKTIQLGVAEKTVRDIPADLFLSFMIGITLVPLFMRSSNDSKEMVSDPEVIDRIKRESSRLLAQFISVS